MHGLTGRSRPPARLRFTIPSVAQRWPSSSCLHRLWHRRHHARPSLRRPPGTRRPRLEPRPSTCPMAAAPPRAAARHRTVVVLAVLAVAVVCLACSAYPQSLGAKATVLRGRRDQICTLIQRLHFPADCPCLALPRPINAAANKTFACPRVPPRPRQANLHGTPPCNTRQ